MVTYDVREARVNKKTGGFQLTIHILKDHRVIGTVTRHVDKHRLGHTYSDEDVMANAKAVEKKDAAIVALASAKNEVKRLESIGKNMTNEEAKKANSFALKKATEAVGVAEANLEAVEEALWKVQTERPLKVRYVF